MKATRKPVTKGAEEARQQLPAILAAAAAGRTTVITRHGREIAAAVLTGPLRAGEEALAKRYRAALEA